MARTRISKAVVSSSDYKVERTVGEIRREMRKLRSDILYNDRIDNKLYERRMAILDGSADLSIKEEERAYTEHKCFGKIIRIYE